MHICAQEAPKEQDTTKAQAALQEMQQSQPALAEVKPEDLGSMTAADLGSSPEHAQEEADNLEMTQSVAAAAGFADEVRLASPADTQCKGKDCPLHAAPSWV